MCRCRWCAPKGRRCAWRLVGCSRLASCAPTSAAASCRGHQTPSSSSSWFCCAAEFAISSAKTTQAPSCARSRRKLAACRCGGGGRCVERAISNEFRFLLFRLQVFDGYRFRRLLLFRMRRKSFFSLFFLSSAPFKDEFVCAKAPDACASGWPDEFAARLDCVAQAAGARAAGVGTDWWRRLAAARTASARRGRRRH